MHPGYAIVAERHCSTRFQIECDRDPLAVQRYAIAIEIEDQMAKAHRFLRK
jgi:hypothetical protein